MHSDRFIASRIFQHGKGSVSSGIVRIAVLSVALGIAIMIVSVAVVVGFKQQIRDKVIGFVAHIQIEPLSNNSSMEAAPLTVDEAYISQLASLNNVKHVQKVALKAGIVKTDEHIQGLALKGVDKGYDWTYLKQYLIDGSLPAVGDSLRTDEVLISSQLASRLLLTIGDPLRMWFVSAENQQPRGRRFVVAGIYETGLAEFDALYIFGDLRHVQRLNNWEDDQIGMIELLLHNVDDLEKVAGEVYFSTPFDLTSTTAREAYPHIFDWLDLQDMNVIIIIILMVLVSGITMISTLLIIILERTSMIGILKALGANNNLVQRIFLIKSLRILMKGLIWGNLSAISLMLLQLHFGFLKLPAESYYLSEVPVYFSMVHILIINGGAVFIWLLTLLIPTSIVNRIQPSKAIRFA